MAIENIMYFVLGVLVAGLFALIVIPAVWRRAVRLTKKRIEAATPMSMAEFRADKDQLRAEFALSTRRLEMTIETLRRRLADQLQDIGRASSEVSGIKVEREQHQQIVRDLERREAEARSRILELEKESADVTQKLRMRDRELAEKSSQLDATRAAGRAFSVDGKPLSGDYGRDVEQLLGRLRTEQKRAEFLETQAHALLAQLENSGHHTAQADATAAQLREELGSAGSASGERSNELVAAEARIADAENRVSTLLAETTRPAETGERQRDMLLAERIGLEEDMEALRSKVVGIEQTVMADWDTDRIEQPKLRERLNDVASDVARLVQALDGSGDQDSEESLLDRVQKFADTPVGDQPASVRGPNARPPEAPVSDRLKALWEMQEEG